MSEHVTVNRDYWNAMAHDWVGAGERLWSVSAPTWGIWGIPESDLRLLPGDMSGLDAIELGCGTGYVSSWMARRGARVTGIDVSDRQLATARRLAAEHDVSITLIEGNAEKTDLPAESFDFAISEYGAAIWCNPDIWMREAWRLLRPGGELIFLGNHPLLMVCSPLSGADCDFTLHRPYRNLGMLDWTDVDIDPGGMEFNLTIGDWMRLFIEIGFEVRDFKELYAPEQVTGTRFTVPAEWGKRYPSEQVWRLRKPAAPL